MTQAQALLWIGSGIAVTIATVWVLLLNHGSVPHEDSVHKDLFDRELVNQAEWRDEQRADFNEIKNKLEDMNRYLHQIKEKG